MFDVNFENIPDYLKQFPQWVLWTIEEDENGKDKKVPYSPHYLRHASTTDPRTWTSYDFACEAMERNQGYGLGFVFTESDDIVGIDIDHCHDQQSGQWSESAYAIMQRLRSYTEWSPSGTGIHILARGTIPKAHKENGIEFYKTKRFFTITGNHIGGTPIDLEPCEAEILALYHDLFAEQIAREQARGTCEVPPGEKDIGFPGSDDELIQRAQRGPGGFEFHKLWTGEWDGGKYGSQSEADLALASMLGWWCGPSAERIDRLFRRSGLMRAKWDQRRGELTYGEMTVDRIVRTLTSWYHNAPRAEQEQAESEFLPIVVTNRPMRDITTETLYALQLKNDPPFLFTRSGKVTRVVIDEEKAPKIELATEPMLRGIMTRSANYFAVVAEKQKKREPQAEPGYKKLHKFPAKDIAADILSLPEKPFPPLIGITECPTLRPSGSVVTVAGYDQETRMMFAPSEPLALQVSTNPTQLEAEVALNFLCQELLVDFPFASPADRANYLGCLLTPIVRPAIDGCVPLCLIDKPTPGSGATLLSDLVAVVATGRAVEKHAAPHGRNSGEEWGKKLTAILLPGPPLVIFDNVEDTLVSEKLCIALTSMTWGDRILSTSISASIPIRTTWIATANNISIAGDLARRCYRVWIDPKMERPWTRENFRHPHLLAWAREHRGEILSALLTIARAWVVAGRPFPQQKVAALGSFEAWTVTINGMLSYAGVEGFLQNLEEVYRVADDSDGQWTTFFSTWFEILGDRPVTIRYLASRIAESCGFAAGLNSQNESLFSVLPDEVGWDETRQDSSRKKLGKALKKHVNRIHGYFRLEQGEKDVHANSMTWKVRDLRV